MTQSSSFYPCCGVLNKLDARYCHACDEPLEPATAAMRESLRSQLSIGRRIAVGIALTLLAFVGILFSGVIAVGSLYGFLMLSLWPLVLLEILAFCGFWLWILFCIWRWVIKG